VALSRTTTPGAELETYAAGNETDVDNDSGIEDASVNSPSVQQPLSHNDETVDQFNTNHETRTSNFAWPMASDQEQGSLEASKAHAVSDKSELQLPGQQSIEVAQRRDDGWVRRRMGQRDNAVPTRHPQLRGS
jgi:hypothetical protein